jgi:hypothetical protein
VGEKRRKLGVKVTGIHTLLRRIAYSYGTVRIT